MADSTDALSSPTATATKGTNKLLVFYFLTDYNISLGTKREAELDDVSPTKLKALKATNGTNGDAPTAVVDDDSSNHKNGDYHDEDDEDDDDVC
jgi:hypothetical protein